MIFLTTVFVCLFIIPIFFHLFRYSNELLGLEGMVKIKNPDEHLLNGNHTISIGDSDVRISTNDITDSKRFNTNYIRILIHSAGISANVKWFLFRIILLIEKKKL